MKKFTLIYMLVAVCALLLTSCEPSDVSGSGEFSVSLRNPKVASDAGTQFLDVKCSGDWTLALVADGAEEVDWASLSVYSGTGDKANVRFTYKTNSTEVERSLTIYLDNGSKSVFCTFTQHAGEYRPDDGPEDDEQTPSGGVDLTKTGWIELPAMDNPDLDYYTHSFKMNGNTYRNYSFGYSNKDYLAVWVAYPLCDLYTNGSSSGGTWEDNPLVDDKYEPNFKRSFGFNNYGYERGHQIANADRKCCAEANQQTYYFTNATLQHKSFNGPVWGTLEGNMRTAAKSADTLYVVTGCTLSASPQYVTDPDGRRVPVPSGYFKAAVRYHKSSTISQWLGAAFYMDHDADKYPTQQVTAAESMSIDELETKLGIDFFVNLPGKVGEDKAAAIEAQNPDSYTSVWSIK
jgi:DNA/RNA endonuclease G (NUC1)/predicted small secreted protein